MIKRKGIHMSSGIGRELLDEMRSDVQEMVRKRIDDEVS